MKNKNHHISVKNRDDNHPPRLYLQKRQFVREVCAVGSQPPYQNPGVDILVDPGVVLDGRHSLSEPTRRYRFVRLGLARDIRRIPRFRTSRFQTDAVRFGRNLKLKQRMDKATIAHV